MRLSYGNKMFTILSLVTSNEICFLPKSLGCFYSVWYSYIWRSMLPFLRYCISKMCVMDTHWCIHACTHYHHCIQIHLSSVRSQREITINDYPKSERHTITCTHNHILPSPPFTNTCQQYWTVNSSRPKDCFLFQAWNFTSI